MYTFPPLKSTTSPGCSCWALRRPSSDGDTTRSATSRTNGGSPKREGAVSVKPSSSATRTAIPRRRLTAKTCPLISSASRGTTTVMPSKPAPALSTISRSTTLIPATRASAKGRAPPHPSVSRMMRDAAGAEPRSSPPSSWLECASQSPPQSSGSDDAARFRPRTAPVCESRDSNGFKELRRADHRGAIHRRDVRAARVLRRLADLRCYLTRRLRADRRANVQAAGRPVPVADRVRRDDEGQPADSDYSSKSGLKTTFQLRGGTQTIPDIPRGTAGLELLFEREEAVAMALKGARHSRIDDIQRLKRSLLAAVASRHPFPDDWFVVTDVMASAFAERRDRAGQGGVLRGHGGNRRTSPPAWSISPTQA